MLGLVLFAQPGMSQATISAWGSDSHYQLGHGPPNADSPTPVTASVWSGGVKVLAGAGRRTVALKPDGTIWTWGNGSVGEAGNGGTEQNIVTPVQANISGVADIAAGYGFALALKDDGTLWSWGYNSEGQLGVGSCCANSSIPLQVNITGVAKIAGGYYHSLALKTDGTVWAWGRGDEGQLGDGANVDRTSPVQVSGLTNVVAIATLVYTNLALKSDGTVWSWGYGRWGQLGNGTGGFNTDRNTPVQVTGLAGVKAVAGGYTHMLALKNDGTVWAWGRGDEGELGNGTDFSSYIPIQVSNLSGVAAIKAGQYHNLALMSNGTVWSWGYNINGQVGDGTTINRFVPAQVSGLTNVAAIAAGDFHSLAVINSDSTPPVIAPTVVGTAGMNGWYTSSVTVSWSETDAESGIASSTGCGTQTLTSNTPGTRLTCSATNGTGRVASVSVTVKIDQTPPVIVPTVTGTLGANGFYTSDVTVTWSVTDSESGIATSTGCGTVNLTANTPGTTLTCSATNGAGLSGSAPVTIKINKTAPVITPTINGPIGANGWYTGPVNLSWSVTDTESGIATSTGCVTQTFTANTPGTTLTCSATNGAGLSTSGLVNIKIDQAPPVIVPTANGTLGANGYYIGPVTVSWTTTDPESGIASSTGCGTQTLTSNTQGTTLTCSATNGAGLTASVPLTIKIDSTPPVIVPTITGTLGANGFYRSNVTITWSVFDLDSGLTAASGCSNASSVTLTDTPGTPLTCSATNGSGLVTSVPITIKIDKTSPSISGSRLPAPNAAGWNNTDVTASFICTDGTSGVASLSPVTTLFTTEGANQSVTGICSDNAGNQATATVGAINIDKTKPAAANVAASPNPVALNTAFTLSANLSDTGGSNLASAEYSINGGAPTALGTSSGPAATVLGVVPGLSTSAVYYVCVHALDKAGNVGVDECIFLPVYNPAGGFVTGGGWIQSPAGAYVPNPSITGKATFGFVAKYAKGATLPSGNTEFQFKVGNLNFKSTAYEWLVIAGARAQYKGAGTINGAGSYNFLLTAIDGDLPGGGGADRFRIKIWNASGAVYDNQMGADDNGDPTTNLGGGSIVIHKD